MAWQSVKQASLRESKGLESKTEPNKESSMTYGKQQKTELVKEVWKAINNLLTL